MTRPRRSILLVDDHPKRSALARILRGEGNDVEEVTPALVVDALKRCSPDIAIVEHTLGGSRTEHVLQELTRSATRSIVVTSTASGRARAQRFGAMQLDAPYDVEVLLDTLVLLTG